METPLAKKWNLSAKARTSPSALLVCFKVFVAMPMAMPIAADLAAETVVSA